MKEFFQVAATIAIVAVALGLGIWRVVEIKKEWKAQPAEVKAAATTLRQNLEGNAKQHDLIRYKDGHLAIVEPGQGGNFLHLRSCGSFESYDIDSENLAQQAVALIPYSSTGYGDAAKQCIAMF